MMSEGAGGAHRVALKMRGAVDAVTDEGVVRLMLGAILGQAGQDYLLLRRWGVVGVEGRVDNGRIGELIKAGHLAGDAYKWVRNGGAAELVRFVQGGQFEAMFRAAAPGWNCRRQLRRLISGEISCDTEECDAQGSDSIEHGHGGAVAG